MKSRRVILTLECETEAPLSILRHPDSWNKPNTYVTERCNGGNDWDVVIVQAQANVVRAKKTGRFQRRKARKAK